MPVAAVEVDGPLGDVVAQTLAGGAPAWEVRRGWRGSRCDLVILDESMEEPRRRFVAKHADAPCLVLGLDLAKPLRAQELRRAAWAAFHPRTEDDATMVALDPPLVQALRLIELAAPRKTCVLIVGPTGVGKEALARRVHERSSRSGQFIAVNCAALSEGLVESTLFGHVRGAFTGAFNNAEGVFLGAHGGTLFLDEIGELDPKAQAKLLRVLEEGAVRPVGTVKMQPVDVRLVAATNRDLLVEVEAGRFRADLYYRLAGCVLSVPALKQRPRDLQALVARFMRTHDRSAEVQLSRDAWASFLSYGWPGNVRELRNIVDRVMMLAEPGELDARTLWAIAPDLARATTPAKIEEGASRSLAELEEAQIAAALAAAGGCLAAAAETLGIHRTTLWRRLRKNTTPPSRSSDARPKRRR